MKIPGLCKLMLGFLLSLADPSADGLDLPVLPPTYSPATATAPAESPDARTGPVQLIPDAGTPLAELPPDPGPVPFYGQEIHPEQNTLIYVLDFSGSMGEHTAGQIIVQDSPTSTHVIPIFFSDRLKEEFAESVRGLAPSVRFNVITFDCAVLQWQPSLVRAARATVEEAVSWVEAKQPAGGTGTSAALATALADKEAHAVILLTDGKPNCNLTPDQHLAAVRVANSQHAPIHCFALGREPQADSFCLQVATESGGTYTEIQ